MYQEGWRLGGKGASGRGASGRIEEHGLHVWLGFYDNAFRMMRECYSELGQPFDDAFVPEHDVGLFAPADGGGSQNWVCRFPARPGRPGDPLPAGATYSLLSYFQGALEMLQAMLIDLEVHRRGDDQSQEPDDGGNSGAEQDVIGAIRMLLGRGMFGSAVAVAQALGLMRTAIGLLLTRVDAPVLRLAQVVADAARQWIEDAAIAGDQQRHLWELIDLVVAATVGAIRFNLLTDPRGLDAIDDYDCREWLRLNGASERALDSPFIRGLYDLMFAYENGDSDRPAVAAGASLRGWLRMFFGYRGAIFWRMRAGMGDVMFAPLYQLLERRGVRFAFFHRLANIGLAAAGQQGEGGQTHVQSLDFDVQAKVHGGEPYRPLIEVAGRRCWPARPDFSQLQHGEALAGAGVDFEAHACRRRAGTLRVEVGRDFDFVVLGVGLGAVPFVAPELLAWSQAWRDMVAHVKTVPTQAFQVWLTEDLNQLGWAGRPHIVSASPKPFETWCDMAHVIPEEDWATPPATVVYFCSALAEPGGPFDSRDGCMVGVAKNAIRQLGHAMRSMWPGAYDKAGEFRWSLLADPAGETLGAPGQARFQSQYWRANTNPTERYVQSLPGTMKYRISPLDMTFDNFTITGDWTECGLNTGCAESAVIAGRLAAHALSGLPLLEDITGYDHP
jgi:uncharacterized protein with NAD-binding domain and iron-sulfur cluster